MKYPLLAVLEGAIIGSGMTESAWLRSAINQALVSQGFDVDAIASKPSSLTEIVEALRTALGSNQTKRRCGKHVD